MLRSISVIGLTVLAAAPALAEGPSYNYLQFGYAETEIDLGSGFDVDGDGFAVAGSFEVGDSMHIFADYGAADFDFGVDFDQIEVGLGFHSGLSENVDFVGRLSYVTVEASGPGGSIDEDGLGASIGVRAMTSESLELAGFINYVDLGDGSNDTSISAEGWYSFNETFAFGVVVDAGDDVTSYGVGARLYFSQ